MTKGVPHPDDPKVICELTKRHPECTGWSEHVGDYVDWPNPDFDPGKKIKGSASTTLSDMHARAQPAPTVGPIDGFPAGEQGSQRAALSWTPEETREVDLAILAVADRLRGGGEFTSDDIWAELEARVPVTKGLTARLMKASRAGLIDTTGKFAISSRGGHHDHGQRLSIWYSLLPREDS